MIGSGIAAMISVGMGVQATSIGVGGIPGILSIFPQYMLYFAIAMLVAIIVPFVLTMIIGKKKLSNEDRFGKENVAICSKDRFVSPMSGKVMALSDVEDQVFSQGLMGQGFAVEINDSKVIAPFDGEVVMTFPTGHAYGLRNSDGVEVLIHIGMDTVELNGEGFHSLVKQGDKVQAGDVLAEVDIECIKKAGKSLVSPIVFTSGQDVKLIDIDKINAGNPVVEGI